MGYVEQLLTLLTGQHSACHENFMAALRELLTDNADAIKEAMRVDLQMLKFIEDRIAFLNGKEEYEVEFICGSAQCRFQLFPSFFAKL